MRHFADTSTYMSIGMWGKVGYYDTDYYPKLITHVLLIPNEISHLSDVHIPL